MGVVFFAIGLPMTFRGFKFIYQLFACLICLLVTLITYGALSNAILKEENYVKIIVFIVCLMVGGIVARFMQRFAERYAVPLVAAYIGFMIGDTIFDIFLYGRD